MKITLYSNHCPVCIRLENLLKSKNIKFNEINNIDTILKKGFNSIPVLEIDGKTLDYINAKKWINERKGI